MGTTNLVGAATIPVPAGAALSAASDPIVDAMLDYLAFWLKNALDAKMAQQSPMNADACPTANRFNYDPGSYWVRNAKPALYVWWKGPSTITNATLVYDFVERDLGVFYVHEEEVAPNGIAPRAGLMALANATIAKACLRQFHPLYAYGSGVAGQLLTWQMGAQNDLGFSYLGGEAGQMSPVPVNDPRPGGSGEGEVVRFFPALQARIHVSERIAGDQMTDPTDVLGDATVTISTNETGDPTDVLPILDRYLPGYDGEA